MLGLASSSRLPATLSPTLMFVRTKKTSKGSHFVKEQAVRAYKPRVPKPRSPHDIRTPNPNAGASQAHPLEYQPFIPKTTSVALEDSYLRLHHSPPASAPTYTTGVVPTLLQWLGGNSVNLSGEEAARLRYKAKTREVAAEGLAPPREWSEETKAKIVSLREQGMSQGRIIKKLGYPKYQKYAIARIAPESPAAKDKREAAASRRWDQIGYRRRVLLAIRERRKEFW